MLPTDGGRLVPLRQLARELGLHFTTLYRHARRGIKGVYLEVECRGGRLLSSHRHWEAFNDQLHAALERRRDALAAEARQIRDRDAESPAARRRREEEWRRLRELGV